MPPLRRKLPRLNLTDLIEQTARILPGGNEEYLVCSLFGETHGKLPWEESTPRTCPKCFSELHVHLPRPFRWELIYIAWRNRFFPYRIYMPPQGGKPGKRWWEWRKHRFLVRPYQGMDWMEL